MWTGSRGRRRCRSLPCRRKRADPAAWPPVQGRRWQSVAGRERGPSTRRSTPPRPLKGAKWNWNWGRQAGDADKESTIIFLGNHNCHHKWGEPK
ncbi:hypothetical protein M5D96_000899 [Drosophila gunungcola]|uniref:Uncharacterized protein n=1 Tax=Drosophila gunungcola TaxID=103775 RepID=A0A9P9YX42_9MUSC|nr:hypothetical protein M5D96_000899 [Drosophila gunungcola]